MDNKYFLNPCQTDQEISDAVKLRYLAYRNVEAINENETGEFKDDYDLLANSKTCLIYEDNAPVASIRACVYSRAHNFLRLPALEVYKDEIEKAIGLDKIIVESNRFVIDPEKVDSKILFKIPFRFIILNVAKFRADYIITAVRTKHVPLYRRFFGMEPISGPKKYPGINVEMVMMAADCHVQLPLAMAKDEIFRIEEEEINRYQFNIPALGN